MRIPIVLNMIGKISIPLLLIACHTKIFAADLTDVFKQAIIHHPEARISKLEEAVQEKNAQIASSFLLPTVALDGQYRLYEDNAPGLPKASYSFTVKQPLFHLHAFSKYRAAAEAGTHAEIHYQQRQQQFILKIIRSYFNALQSYNTLKVAQLNKTTSDKMLRSAQSGFKVGLVTSLGLHEAVIADQAVNASLTQDQLNWQIAQYTLYELTGQQYNHLATTHSIPKKTILNTSLADWEKQARIQSTAIRMAQQQFKVARLEHTATQMKHAPTLFLSGAYTMLQNNEGEDFQVSKSLSLQFNFPLFSSGRTMLESTQSAYKQSISEEKLHLIQRATILKTRSLYQSIASSKALIDEQKKQSVALHALLKSSLQAYTNGSADTSSVLSIQKKLYDAERLLIKTRCQTVIQIAEFQETIGILDSLQNMSKK